MSYRDDYCPDIGRMHILQFRHAMGKAIFIPGHFMCSYTVYVTRGVERKLELVYQSRKF
jgi:hypothetical protein